MYRYLKGRCLQCPGYLEGRCLQRPGYLEGRCLQRPGYLEGRCLQRPARRQEAIVFPLQPHSGVASNAPPSNAFVAIAASLFLFFTTGIAQQTPGQETAPLSAEAQEAASQGVSFFRQNQLPEAREQFEKVTQLAPTHPFGWVNLGSTDFRLGQTDRAEEELKKAVRLDPTAEQAWLTLGIISYQKDALDAGLAALSQAVYLDPKDAKAHLYLGVLIRKKGWLTGAEDEMRKALELDEGNAEAHFNLAVLCLEEKPPAIEIARRHYYRALDLGAQPDPEIELKFKKKAP